MCLLLLTCAAPGRAQGTLVDPVWTAGTPIPGAVMAGGSCVGSQGYIFCVGGTRGDGGGNTYYAPFTAEGGIGAWRQGTPYGEGGSTTGLSCAADGGYMFCVGGSNLEGQSGDVTSDVWFAPISQYGIGAWTKTMPYGMPQGENFHGKVAGLDIWNQSCVAHQGHLYCIGGEVRTYSLIPTPYGAVSTPFDAPSDTVLRSTVGGAGAGGWYISSAYPRAIAGEGCAVSGDYIYCAGGVTGDGIISSYDVSDVYYARIQDDGTLGSWRQTQAYGGGAVDGLSCTTAADVLYCVGGDNDQAWMAPLSPTGGVLGWLRQQDYPREVYEASCVADQGQINCVGGGEAGYGGTAGSNDTHHAFFTPNWVVKSAPTCEAGYGIWDEDSHTCTLDTWYGAADQLEAIGPPVIGTVTVPDGMTLHIGTHASVAITGALVVASGGGIVNDGSISVSGTATNAGAWVNNASLRVTGTMNNGGTLTNNGQLTIPSGGSFQNAGIFIEACAGTLTGAIGGNPPSVNSCHATASSLAPGTSSADNGGALTLTDTITDLDGAGSVFTAAPVFDDDGAGGSFGPVTCAPQAAQLACGVVYTAANHGNGNLFTAIYQDATHQKSVAHANFTLLGLPTTLRLATSANPALPGSAVTYTAALSPAPASAWFGTPEVSFYRDGVLFGLGPLDGATASFTSPAVAGTHIIRAVFASTRDADTLLLGSSSAGLTQLGMHVLQDGVSCAALGGNWNAATATCTVFGFGVTGGNSFQVNPGVTLVLSPSIYTITTSGTVINYGTIRLLGTPASPDTSGFLNVQPGGTLDNRGLFIDGGSVGPSPGGHLFNSGEFGLGCNITLRSGFIGNPPVSYCDPETLRISPQPLRLAAGGTAAFTAVIEDAVHPDNPDTGSVSWNLRYTSASCAFANNRCTVSFTAPPTLGPLTIAATTSGDPTHPPAHTAFQLQIVAPSSVLLTGTPAATAYGAPVVLAAALTPADAGGSVSYFDGVIPIGAGPVSAGASTFSTALLAPGAHQVQAVYRGDAGHMPSASPGVAETVTPLLQGGFGAPVVTARGAQALAGMAVGDFNRDGRPDLALANDRANSLTVELGQGNGAFAAGATYAAGNGPAAIAVADVNGDGNLDLIVADSTPGAAPAPPLTLLLGNGDGTFQPGTGIAGDGTALSVAAADFNRDGNIDLAAVLPSSAGSPAAILLGNGDGTFTAPAPIPGTVAQTLTVGDFNDDGIADILAVGGGGHIGVALGKGDGTLQLHATLPAPPGLMLNSLDLSRPAVGDFNHDGHADFALTDTGEYGSVHVYLGDGTGAFPSQSTYAAAGGPGAALAGDVNGDGNLDLVVAAAGDFHQGAVLVYLGQGNGGFRPAMEYPMAPPAAVVAGNFGGDGLVGLAAMALGTGDLAILPGKPATGLAQGVTFPPPVDAVYGGASPRLAAVASSGLPIAFSAATPATCGVADGAVTLLAAGLCSITASQPGSANYAAAAPVSHSFTIAPATLTVAPDAASRYVGAANPAFTGTITGLVAGDAISAAYASAADASTPAGVYATGANAIAPTLADPDHKLGNYTVTLNLGTLTINPAPLPPAARITAAAHWSAPGVLAVALTVTNSGAGAASSLMISHLLLRPLGPGGTPTLAAPALPISVGALASGASTQVVLSLNVPAGLRRFTLTEQGSLTDAAGIAHAYSSGQAVLVPRA